METYNDLFVRLQHGSTAQDVLARLNAVAQDDMEWELEEDLGGAAGYHAMGGSMGWELTDAAAEALRADGQLEVWTYSTHDEEPEAVFSRYREQGNTVFIASTAFEEGFSEDEDEEDAPSFEATPEHLLTEEQWRAKLGENGYCWSRFERWIEGMPVFHRRKGHEELIEDIVGPRRTKADGVAG